MGKAQVSIETLQMIKDMIEGKSATQIAGEHHYSGPSPIIKRVIQACENMGVSYVFELCSCSRSGQRHRC